jgi:hypothetical protein
MTALFGGVLGTLSVLAFNATLAVALTGVGLVLRRGFGLMKATLEDWFTAFWMGFGLVIVFLMLWNFFLPLGGGAPLVIVLVTGMTGVVAARRWGWVAKSLWESAPPLWAVVSAVLFSLWVSNLSLGLISRGFIGWDSALYHMQGVKWASSYPAVPGLGNVFGPLAFNNASFLWNAMLDSGPWSGRAWHVSNSVLVSVFGAQLILSASRMLDRNTPVHSFPVFALVLLPEAVNLALDGVPNFMTAVPASLLLMVTATLLYRAFADQRRPADDRAYDFFCTAFLAAIAVAIKTSAAVFAAAVLLVSCYGVLRFARDANPARTIVWTVAAVTAIGLTWLARGVILSGYPLFPSPVLAFPVDWRVPVEHARAEFDFVVHSARATAENYSYVSGDAQGLAVWLPHWGRVAAENLYEFFVPVGLTIVAAFFFLWSNRQASAAQRKALRAGWLILPPLVIAVAAWSLVAPMPSYGAPFFWSLAALIGAQAFSLVPRTDGFVRRVFVAGSLLGATPSLINPAWFSLPLQESGSASSVLTAVLHANINVPQPGSWFHSNTPPQVAVYTTNTGVVLNVPIGPGGRCWDAPLPCTPNPAPNLRLRVPGSIEKGFTVDDLWQMRDWPEPWRPKLLPAMREGWRKRDGTAPAKRGRAGDGGLPRFQPVHAQNAGGSHVHARAPRPPFALHADLFLVAQPSRSWERAVITYGQCQSVTVK